MGTYIIKRSILFIPTLLLVTLVVFTILRVVPGDPAMMILGGEDAEDDFTQEQLDALRAKLGTDKPIHIQYFRWIGGMMKLDFGISYFYEGDKVIDDMKDRIPVTVQLGLMSLILASVVAIPMGVISAIKQDTVGDYVTRVVTIMGIALPNFWVAIMTIFFLVLFFNWAPPLAYVPPWEDPWVNFQQLIFPAIALGTSNMAFIARITRSAMLEVLHDDYIRTARAKGLNEGWVLYRHALKNAILPVVTVSGYQFARLLGGVIIIETIFVVPGLGAFLIESIQHRDFVVLQAVIVLTAAVVLTLNLVIDLCYGILDPRIRYS